MFAKIKPLHPNFKAPVRAEGSAGFDIFMPEGGEVYGESKLIGLGFATKLPDGFVALLLPRSSTGAKHGLEVNNTVGVIDPNYRGEWKAALKTKSGLPFKWEAGERLLQFVLVPFGTQEFVLSDDLEESHRNIGGFGSTGK